MADRIAHNLDPMITFDSVSKAYSDDTVALENVSFSIDPNEFVSLVGHSGAGKSTLIRMLLAEERPSAGKVFLSNTDVHTLRSDDINYVRRNIGVVFQDFRLLAHKNIFENISFAMEAAGRTDDDIDADVPYVLELVGLERKMWRFPHELSGGEKQRVAIARAIVNQPDVVIADEPTGNLDPQNTYEIVQILKKINDLGTLVLLTTHNTGVIDSLDNRVISMENGRIVRDDKQAKHTI